MKSKQYIHRGLAGRSSQWLGACSITFCVLTAGQAMAQLTWTGAANPLLPGSTAWSNNVNWVNTSLTAGVPVNGTVLNFGGAVYHSPTNQPTDNDIAGLTTGQINFSSDGVAAQTFAFTLGKADLSQSITLGGTISTSISGSANVGTSFTDTINLNLVLNAARIITTNASGTRTHNLNVFGVISEDGLGTYGLTKSGGASLGLANTANTFAGDFTITGGTVFATSLQPSGANSSIGKGSVINLSGGTLSVSNIGSTTAVAPTGPINRTINFSNTGGINIESGGNFIISGAFNNTTTSAKTFGLGGGSGTGDFQGLLANNTGVVSLLKSGASSWTLSAANTYSGDTFIDSGTLNVSTIADSGSSNLGIGSGVIRMGAAGQTGNLNYTGSTGASTARQLAIGTVGGNNNGGATILNNGTNAGTGLRFTSPNFNSTTSLSAHTRTLTLGGSNTDANEISGIIGNATLTNQFTALAKTNVGRWILSNTANKYLGATLINEGTLEVKVLRNIATDSSLGAPALAQSVIRLGNSGSTGTLTYTGSGDATNRQIQIGNGLANFENGGSTIISSGTGGPLEFTNIAFNSPVDTGTGSGVSITTRTLTLSGSNTGDNRIAGVIANNNQTETPNVAVTKFGAGKWVLSGTNTYTGATGINGGTLSVNTISDAGISAIGNTGALNLGGGTLSYSGASSATTARQVNLTANSTIDLPSGSLDVSDGTSGAFVLNKTGVGILVLSGSGDNNSLLLNAMAGEVHLAKDITANIRAVAGITGIGNGATVKLIGPGIDQIFSGNVPNQGVNGIVAGGTLDLNGKSEAISFLNGTGGVVDGAVAGGSGTVNFTVGQTEVSASFGGVIKNTTGTLALIKTGAGTQVLSGSNSYTGATTINNGTLMLTGATQATSSITSTGGGQLGLDVGSPVTAVNATVNFSGRMVLVTGSPTLASHTLLTASSITGTPTFASPAPSGYALQVVGNELRLVQTDLYASWAGDGTPPFTGDANNDGVQNGLAWLLGASGPNVNANGLLPVVTETSGALVMTFNMLNAASRGAAVLELQHSSDLGITDSWTGVVVPNTTSGSPISFVITPVAPPSNLNSVQATIPSSEAAGGKVFGRLKGIQ